MVRRCLRGDGREFAIGILTPLSFIEVDR